MVAQRRRWSIEHQLISHSVAVEPVDLDVPHQYALVELAETLLLTMPMSVCHWV